jgi:hypothetical protein
MMRECAGKICEAKFKSHPDLIVVSALRADFEPQARLYKFIYFED